MIVVGLTGSIGMGKSTVAEHLLNIGVPVIDADKIVHDLYEGAAVAHIEKIFPGSTDNGKVVREKLSAQLMAAPERFSQLEAIVHPMVRAGEREFLDQQFRNGADVCVIEIPLLFETGTEKLFDCVVVVSARVDQQEERVLQRDGMTREKLQEILKRQMPDEEKRKKADFIVDTSVSIADTKAQTEAVFAKILTLNGTAYHRHWTSA
ncbi:MAG: dephospho-CoA kinase [Hyphomicrobiaceae bacterium]